MNRGLRTKFRAATLATLLVASASALGASAIMEQPMDGSSVEAFEQAMEQVKQEATKEEYTGLKGAINYLMTYDLAIKRDKQKLYRKLDGKTPTEIIGMAGH